MSGDASKGAAADPDAGLLSQSCFDFLMIELVPMAHRIAEQLYTTSGADAPKADDEELREAVFYRLESLGYRVGLGVVESLSQHHPLLPSVSSATPAANLDTIKFICKDLWTLVFHKQIDNLKTNHRGTFVLTDNNFAPLKRASLPAGQAEETRKLVVPFLQFPSGLVRGALSGLGLETTVTVEVGQAGMGVVVTIRVAGRVGAPDK